MRFIIFKQVRGFEDGTMVEAVVLCMKRYFQPSINHPKKFQAVIIHSLARFCDFDFYKTLDPFEVLGK